MKTSKRTDEQITFWAKRDLGRHERRRGLSQDRVPRWQICTTEKYGGLSISGVRRLKQLAEGNNHLKKLVANLCLGKEMPQEALRKDVKTFTRRGASKPTNSGPTKCARDAPRQFCCCPVRRQTHLRDDQTGRVRIYEIAEARLRYSMPHISALVRLDG